MVWNKDKILNNKRLIEETLSNMGKQGMMNVIELKTGKSFIIDLNLTGKKKLENLLKGSFENNVMELDIIWLRKENIKKLCKNLKAINSLFRK